MRFGEYHVPCEDPGGDSIHPGLCRKRGANITRTSPITGLPIQDYRIQRSPLWRRLNWKRILPLAIGLFLIGNYLLVSSGLTEEGKVLQVIAATAEAVENKDRDRLASVLSEAYTDRGGRNREGLLDLAQRFFDSRNTVQIVRLGSKVEFPSDDEAVGAIRYQVIGEVDGAIYRGFTDGALTGEKVNYRLVRESGEWKIVSIDPERGSWR